MSACCRVCLQYIDDAEILDSSLICDEEAHLNYSECFTICTKIVLNINDGLPYNLCKACGVELQMAYDFYKKVEKSKEILAQGVKEKLQQRQRQHAAAPPLPAPIKIVASTSAQAMPYQAASSFSLPETIELANQEQIIVKNELSIDQYDEDMEDTSFNFDAYHINESEKEENAINQETHSTMSSVSENYSVPETAEPKIKVESRSPTPEIICYVNTVADSSVSSLSERLNIMERNQELIMQQLKENHVITNDKVKTLVKQLSNVETDDVIFPLQSIDDLKDLNKKLEANPSRYTEMIRRILMPEGLHKNFRRLFCLSFAFSMNYSGSNNKIAFDTYKAFSNAIYEATKRKGYTFKQYSMDIRYCFKKMKNTHYKTKCYEKKILSEQK